MTPVRITISYRDGVLDPVAQAVERSLHNLGYDGVQDVTLSKLIDLNLAETDPDKVCEIVDDMCKRLLVNEVMETYRITLKMHAATDTFQKKTNKILAKTSKNPTKKTSASKTTS